MRIEQMDIMPLLIDDQWKTLSELPQVGRLHAVGRKPSDDREVFEAVLWVMRHQARWMELPREYPSPRTCQRRLKRWIASNTWSLMWRDYLQSLDTQRLAMWREPFEVLALRESRGGDHRIGRPPFWRAAAIDYWWYTWDLQPAAVQDRLKDIVEPLMLRACGGAQYAPPSSQDD